MTEVYFVLFVLSVFVLGYLIGWSDRLERKEMPQPHEEHDVRKGSEIEGLCGACAAKLPNETHAVKNLADHRAKVYCPVLERWDFVKPSDD